MGKLSTIFKWKKPLVLKDKTGGTLKDEDGNPVMVYVRVIGDYDLEEASRKARLASAVKRTKLVIPDSEEYLINISIIDNATEEQCKELIKQGGATNWTAEAYSAVEVPELPKIDEIAKDPDAPTLEELEKLDKAMEKANEDYRAAMAEYVVTKSKELEVKLEGKSLEDLRQEAKDALIIILSIEEYLRVLKNEKAWRSVFQDEKYTLPEFANVEEFMQTDEHIRNQIHDFYDALEAGLEPVKN